MKFNVLPGIFALILVSSLFGQSASKKVAEANKLFEQEKYDEANNKYRDALIEIPDSPIIHFNIGDVQYKKRNYDEALNSYTKALASDDILLQSQAHYNLGNTLYRLGKLPESILEYKRALELNPDDEDAKYNLEYVRAKLKDNAQQQQQNQQQRKNQDQQQNQEQQQENQQNQEDQQEKQQNREQDSKEQEQGQQEKQEEGVDDEQDRQQQQAQTGEQQEISKEDAERILDALKNEEEDLLRKNKTTRRGRAFRGKDW